MMKETLFDTITIVPPPFFTFSEQPFILRHFQHTPAYNIYPGFTIV